MPAWKNNSLFSYWGSPFARPASVQHGPELNKTYDDVSTALVHMFHGGLWGGWQFSVASHQPNTSELLFGYGGFQEARGSGVKKGQHYFIENVLEELDTPGEWFLDSKQATPVLYFWPNSTAASDAASTASPAAPAEVVLPLLDTLVSVDGATNLSFTGLEFTETRATFLEMYEVPSGGDWSIHRCGLRILASHSIPLCALFVAGCAAQTKLKRVIRGATQRSDVLCHQHRGARGHRVQVQYGVVVRAKGTGGLQYDGCLSRGAYLGISLTRRSSIKI